jgi:hypothetical protein
MEPLTITRFEYGGKAYRLKEPLLVEVQYEDDVWIYYNASINLWGYGERREEALRDLNENFAYLCEAFADERDDVLASRAILIKRLLRGLSCSRQTG